MATAWQSYRSGAFDNPSNNATSPWYDGSTQSALSSYPYAVFPTDTFNISTSLTSITAPSVAISGSGAGTIAALCTLTTGAYAFTMGNLTLTTTAILTTGAGQFRCGTFARGTGGLSIGSGGLQTTGTVTVTTGGATSFAPGGKHATDGATNGTPGTTFTSATGGFTAFFAQCPTAQLIAISAGSGATLGYYKCAYVSDTTLTLSAFLGGSASPGNNLTGLTWCIPTGGWQADANATVYWIGAASEVWVVNGTAWTNGNFCLFGNINTGASSVFQIQNVPSIQWSFGDVFAKAASNYGLFYMPTVTIISWNFNSLNARCGGTNAVLTYTYNTAAPVSLSKSFLSSSAGTGAGIGQYGGKLLLSSVTFGIDRFGKVGAFLEDLVIGAGAGNSLALFEGHGVRLTSSNPFYPEGSQMLFSDDSYGYANGAGTNGGGFYYDSYRTTSSGMARNTSHKNGAESYCWECTPASTVNANLPLDSNVFIPVTTGDVVTVAGSAQRSSSNLSASAAHLIFDLEGVYSTPSDNTLTLGTGYGTFSLNSGTVTGTGAMRIILRTQAYYSGTYVDWGKLTITVTHTDGSTTVYTVDYSDSANGMPVVNQPIAAAAAGGAPVFGGHIARMV